QARSKARGEGGGDCGSRAGSRNRLASRRNRSGAVHNGPGNGIGRGDGVGGETSGLLGMPVCCQDSELTDFFQYPVVRTRFATRQLLLLQSGASLFGCGAFRGPNHASRSSSWVNGWNGGQQGLRVRMDRIAVDIGG